MNNKNIFSNLRSPELFAKRPVIGWTMFVVGSLIFIALALNLIYDGPLIKWDLYVAEFFHALAIKSPAWVINIMIFGYYFGTWLIVIIGIVLALYFLHKRYWRELTMDVVLIGSSGLIFIFLSHIFDRPRPFLLFDELIWHSSNNIPGFPSGHAKSILICLGFLIYLLVPRIKSHFRKVVVITTASLLIIYVSLSRMYIGDHYLTDIIAGYAVGIAWLGLVCTSVELLFQKYSLKKGKRKLYYEKRKRSYK